MDVFSKDVAKSEASPAYHQYFYGTESGETITNPSLLQQKEERFDKHVLIGKFLLVLTGWLWQSLATQLISLTNTNRANVHHYITNHTQ